MDVISTLIGTCKKHAHKAAVIINGSATEYEALWRGIQHTAASLAATNIKKGSLVFVNCGNTVEHICLLFACFMLGAIYIPVDKRLKQHEMAAMIGYIHPDILLTDHAGFLTAFENVKTISIEQLAQRGAGRVDAAWDGCPQEGEADALIHFTSGTSGTPKAVVHTQNSIFQRYVNYTSTLAIDEKDIFLTALPISHSFAMGSALIPSLLSGATLILEEEFIPPRMLRLIEAHRITIFHGVPYMYKMLADTERNVDFTSVRLAVSASSPLSREIYHSFYQKYGVMIQQEYGSTETGPMCIGKCGKLWKVKIPVGKPLNNVDIKILGEDGEVLEEGKEGIVSIHTGALMKGYFDPAQKCCKPLDKGYYMTNDLGYVDHEGQLFITARRNHLINIAGLKVDPCEVENVLLQCPLVSDALVVGERDQVANQWIKAYIVPRNHTAPKNEIIAFCRERLADHKIPHALEYVDAIGRDALGKVKKAEKR